MRYTDVETVLRHSGLFQKYWDASATAVDYTKHRPAFAELSMSTFQSIAGERLKPGSAGPK